MCDSLFFRRFLVLFGLTLFLSLSAQAYAVFSSQETRLSISRKTHLIVLGTERSEDGSQFLLSALSTIRAYQQYHPDYQYLVIVQNLDAFMYGGKADTLTKAQFKSVSETPAVLTGSRLVEFLRTFDKNTIASLEIFAHSSARYGPYLSPGDDPDTEFNENTRDVAKIHDQFTASGFIFLHGCNTGWLVAPYLAQTINVPVVGSLSGSRFQIKSKSSEEFAFKDAYRVEDLDLKAPSSRLYPNQIPYKGHSGDLSGGGLGFYKFFCPQMPTAELRCQSAMLTALMGFPSVYNKNIFTDLHRFRSTVADFLCGALADDPRDSCFKTFLNYTESSNMKYSPFMGPTLKCDFNRCITTGLNCHSEVQDGRSVDICDYPDHPEDANNETYWNEFEMYLSGYLNVQRIDLQ